MVRRAVDLRETIKTMDLTDTAFTSYHSGHGRRTRCPPELKRFIAWDGEGMTIDGEHRYVLFGNSTGEYLEIDDSPTGILGLQTEELLDFIVDQGLANPGAWHIGFAFNYDWNMILKGVPVEYLRKLHASPEGYVKWGRFGITVRASKWFQVSRYKDGYNRQDGKHRNDTVRIYDIFGFFVCPFVKACEDLLERNFLDTRSLEQIKQGKAKRGEFKLEELDYVHQYWRVEIDMLERLAVELRRILYGAELRITQWHGPGALANYKLSRTGIKKHMRESPKEVRGAARYGYAGGRFELFKIGRIQGPIYSIDINSAYPSYIAKLPSLTAGEWIYNLHPNVNKLKRFGIYRVQLHASAGFDLAPGPFFHRDARHNISYPWIVDNWVWAPEIVQFRTLPGKGFQILEGWEYVGYGESDFPFEWVKESYELRRKWKQEKKPSQLALKLMLNSLYGKMAQRVGWNESNKRIPPWHQLEWAGWVTASTRATLYSIMRQIPQSDLIAVETDGIYTTYDPARLGISANADLGGWSVDRYDEIVYIQSGVSFIRTGDEWSSKYRGLDKGSFTIEDASRYLESLNRNSSWRPYHGQSTRFVGLGAALSRKSFHKAHCRWETSTRDIQPGEKGKRIHFPPSCMACQRGESPNTTGHDLVIRSAAVAGTMSTEHHIPWEGRDNTGEWHEYAEEREGLIKEW